MPLTRDEAARLNHLYDRRDLIERNRRTVNLQFWLRLVDDTFKSGDRAELLQAHGDRLSLAGDLCASVDNTLLKAIDEINEEIADLGGQP
jgi:hypothetical protein